MKSMNTSKNKPKPKPRNKSKVKPKANKALLREIEELKSRLAEQEETLRAIRDGEVDALMVSTPEGERVYTLKGAEQTYRIFIETMHEGALLLSPEGTILYANTRFAEMVSMPLEGIVNSPLDRYVLASTELILRLCWWMARGKRPAGKSACAAAKASTLRPAFPSHPFQWRAPRAFPLW